MSDTMIERIARLLAKEAGYNGDDAWRTREPLARKIVGAMREPTEAMWSALYRAGENPELSTGERWTAMIDAALAEEW